MPKPKKHFPPTETPIIVAVKKLLAQAAENVEKRLHDVSGYLTGALEQLMFQQAQHMSVQAAILEYLNEHLAPGSEATIRGIMEANIAKAKAEREAREKQLAEEAAVRLKLSQAEARKTAGLQEREKGFPFHLIATPEDFNSSDGTTATVCGERVNYLDAVGQPEDACCIDCLAKHHAVVVCPSCGSLSPEKCNQPCTDPPAGAYRSVDDPSLGAAPADIVPETPADAAPAESPGSP